MTMELAYTDNGIDRPGVPAVLLHAFPVPGAVFDAVVADLAGRHRVIVPDLRGFGSSPGPGDEPPSLDVMADDVAALLDRLSIDHAVVAGLSMGGYVAMAMLRRHRERVAAVALIDTKASADTEEARDNRERTATAVLEHGTRALRPLLDSVLGATTHRSRPDVMAQVTGWLDENRPDGVAWAQRAMAARRDSFDVIAAADVAGVVIVGNEDSLTGHDDALAMSGAFSPAAPIHVIPDAGHLSPVENPGAVADAMRDVLSRVP